MLKARIAPYARFGNMPGFLRSDLYNIETSTGNVIRVMGDCDSRKLLSKLTLYGIGMRWCTHSGRDLPRDSPY